MLTYVVKARGASGSIAEAGTSRQESGGPLRFGSIVTRLEVAS